MDLNQMREALRKGTFGSNDVEATVTKVTPTVEVVKTPKPEVSGDYEDVFSTRLAFQDSKSDKLYEVTVVKRPDGKYDMVASWGRRGNAMQSKMYVEGATYHTALSKAEEMIRSKKAKGYWEEK